MMRAASPGAAAAAAGRLVLDARGAAPIRGGRPLIGAELLHRLTAGRRAAMLPDLLGAMFSLCAAVHRLTARRAVLAALGHPEPEAETSRSALVLRAATLRDQLQRLALDLPVRVPVGIAVAPAWLRAAPVTAAPLAGGGSADELAAGLRRMPAWLERELLGAAAPDWWEQWQLDPQRTAARWIDRMAGGQGHPVALWHAAVRARAEALQLPCRPLMLLDAEPAQVQASVRELAHRFAQDADFAARPLWLGQPAETGAWTRNVALPATPAPVSAWLRLSARMADLARVACDERALRHGALALGGGEGIAWSEMARGLLVHWVRLERGCDDPALARVEACRVLAPTEWNFHPQGGLARWLSACAPAAADVALAAAALDPCVEFEIEGGEQGSVAQEVVHA